MSSRCGLSRSPSGPLNPRRIRTAAADLSDSTEFLTLVAECLRANPGLVQQWTMFSSDTRTTPWPYFSLERLEVGLVSVKGAFEDVGRWDNGPDACADHLLSSVQMGPLQRALAPLAQLALLAAEWRRPIAQPGLRYL